MPSARAAAAMRSNARATSGRIGLPWRVANGPRYSPAPGAPSPSGAVSGTSSACAVAVTRADRSPGSFARPATRTRMRTGANASVFGKSTTAPGEPLRAAVSAAALLPIRSYAARLRRPGPSSKTRG